MLGQVGNDVFRLHELADLALGIIDVAEDARVSGQLATQKGSMPSATLSAQNVHLLIT